MSTGGFTRGVVSTLATICCIVGCESSAADHDAVAGAADSAVAPAPSADVAAPAPPAAPSPPLFECKRDLDRGFERIVEVSRTDNTSVIQVDTNYWGGATGGVAFGMDCLGKACEQRGFPYYVILSSHAVRYGTGDSPGNLWEATIGFLTSADQDVAKTFPDLVEAGHAYRAWPATGVSATNVPEFVGDVIFTDPWELFSSIHFRYKQPGEKPGDWLTDQELARRADKAEQELAASRDERQRLWKLGEAAKTAAMAGRWESAKSWAQQVLAQKTTDAESGNGPHDAHTALGLVAVHEGDLDAAQVHLLKSGMTAGSPTMRSFGPNMSLAKKLIEAGQTEVVLQYFDECEGFWQLHRETLAQWRAVVEAGGVPDFGANLIY